MKGLSLELGAYNALLWRSMLGAILTLLLFLWRKESWPTGAVLRLHVWRGIVVAATAFLFFWGLKYVPLAEALGLSFIAPLFALYLAAVLLGETISRGAVVASVLGFVGTLVVVIGRLGEDYAEDVSLGIAAILLSAVLYGYNLILQRRQALVASPVSVTFFQNNIIFLLFLLFAPFLAVVPNIDVAPTLAGATVLAIVSSMLITWAYARAEAQHLIPVEYTAFIWGGLFGWLLFAERITVTTLCGTALIVMGCLAASRLQTKPAEHIETTPV